MLFKIMTGVSLGLSLALVGVIIYLNMTKQERVNENRKYMLEVIEKMVDEQIKQSMPTVTGPVNGSSK
tara:strand:- start:427 stop:630 length:204 start_codon:yes stop_codon:yes gene_type:complete